MNEKRNGNLVTVIGEAVERRREEIIEFCRDLIRIPSVTGDEKNVQDFVAKYLLNIGLEVNIWEPDISKLRDHPAYIDTGRNYMNRPNVVGIHRGQNRRSLILNGHTDVITPEPLNKWNHDPWGGEISNGKIYGRGACDMKGGVAGMIKALQILRESGLPPAGDVILELVVDEESSGNGTLASLLEGYNADAAIFTEPTSCMIMPAHRGAMFWRIYVEGRGAHAGVKYRGVSATEKGIEIYRAIEDLEKRRNLKGKHHPLYCNYPITTPICIGKFNSGKYTSAIPQECVLEGTIEFLPGETAKEVKVEFIHAIEGVINNDEWLKENPPRLEWFGLNVEPSQIFPDQPIVETVKRACSKIIGKKVDIIGFPAASDMRIRVLFSKTPSLHFGPGDLSVAHRVDEYIDIDELVMFTKALALVMINWGEEKR